MKKVMIIAVILVGALLIPAVSAEDFTERDYVSWSRAAGSYERFSGSPSFNVITFNNIALYPNIQGFSQTYPAVTTTNAISDSAPFTAKIGSTVVGSGTISYNKNYNSGGSYISTVFACSFDSWDVSGYTGRQHVSLTIDTSNGYSVKGNDFRRDVSLTTVPDAVFFSEYSGVPCHGACSAYGLYEWDTTVNYDKGICKIVRGGASSYIHIAKTDIPTMVYYSGKEAVDKNVDCMGSESITVKIISPAGTVYDRVYTLTGSSPDTPTPTLRTGTVTMSDNNGTTISDFDVRAVNHYTGEEYTFSTDTDIAEITLPMDRTIEIRNPQTGEYEEAPVGYYRFFGQAPGYKMLAEDGIQVSVMPEKYGSYQLCDIRVTSESGYLTGTHQFQIRSRSDNTVLQTGTISAKSATTGEWYNTTVSGGIASLILPYDTSNSISQYAGNYYVYATSPGYEDSDYGTQIVVMPHTVSEIRDIHLTPIGGIPTPGNVTLRIHAFSETGTGVVNAEIFIAGVLGEGSSVWDTYTASSTGYLTVSVPGNSTYDIVASGDGYYDSARRVEVFTEDPPLIEIKLYLSGAPTLEPTTQPTGWPTTQPTTQPTGGIPDEDDDSEGFLMQAVRGIGLAFGVGFATAKLIFGMLLALSIGYATAKQLRGGAAEFGLGLLGGTILGVLIGLLPVWIIVVLLLVVGLYIGNRYVGGSNNG